LALRTLAALCLAAAAAAAAAGCGSDANEESVRQAAQAFFNGARNPTPKFCDVLSREFLRVRTGSEGAKALARCRESAAKARGRVNDNIPANVEITSVTIAGSTATARAEAAGQRPAVLRLVKEGGAWKVDGERAASAQ
jgi:hypothetical protein